MDSLTGELFLKCGTNSPAEMTRRRDIRPLGQLAPLLPLVLAWILVSGSAREPHRPDQPRRIVYAQAGSEPSAFQELGRAGEGRWGLADDQVLLDLHREGPPPQLLYFSEADYRRAVRDLTEIQRVEAVFHRLQHWTPHALEYAPAWLYGRQRRALALAARAGAAGSRSGPAGEALRLQEHFEQGLRLLARLVGEGRYDDVSLEEMLVLALESEAGVIAGRQAAQRLHPDATFPPPGQIDERMRQADALGRELERLGRPEYGMLPYVDEQHVYYVHPSDAELIEALHVTRTPHALWRDGVVTPWLERRREELEEQGMQFTLLYWSAGEFQEDLIELTRAQQEREFEHRLAAGASEEAVGERLAAQQLEHVLLKRNVLAKARQDAGSPPATAPESGGVAGLLEEQLAWEEQALRQALAEQVPWLGKRPESAEAAVERLWEEEKALEDDARLFAALSRRSGWEALAAQMAGIAEWKEKTRSAP